MKPIDFWKLEKDAHKRFVGEQLSHARSAMGLGQAELGRKYGIAQNKLNQWEAGLYYPDPRFLAQLSQDYGWTMDYFYRGAMDGVSVARAGDLQRVTAGRMEA